MKLNLFMCKADVQNFEECLKPKTEKRKYNLINAIKSIDDVEYQIYVVRGDEKTPDWLSFVQGYVEESAISDITNRNCSLAILFRVATEDGNRIFIMSCGFGYHLINKDKVEPNFGLITTLNSVDPKKIKSMDTRSLGVQTLQKREASNLFTDLWEFEFEIDSELLQTISGACSDISLANKMSGTDNLNLSIPEKIELDDIPRKCLAVYEQYKLDNYKARFGFIDHIKYEKDPSVIQELNSLLVDAINHRQRDFKISLAYPDQIGYEQSDVFELSIPFKKKLEVEDVTLDVVYDYLEGAYVELETLQKKFQIIGLDTDTKNPKTTKDSLYSYLIFEADINGKKYILSNKKWYCVEKDYLARVESDLRGGYVKMLQHPVLKLWNHKDDEKRYNLQYQNESDYLWLDAQNFVGNNYGRSKVEIADFFHEPTRKLFFVKKLNRSATLSHLFSQATVSADLFRDSAQYREHFLKAISQKWQNKAVQFNDEYLDDLKFIYAIGTDRQGDLIEMLPVFSKINLLKHLKLLRKLGFDTEIAKVEIDLN